MTKTIYKLGITLAFLPILSIPTNVNNVSLSPFTSDNGAIEVDMTSIKEERAAKLEKYFSDRSMPLSVNAMDFVETAEKYNLDWRLLPAIAIRESSGGKHDMNNNPFGWGSAKIKFNSYGESIDMVGKNLSGNNPRTAAYYKDKSNYEKLYAYNGTVVASYPSEVLDIMDRIGKQEI